jgi:hypothetical protein
MASSWPLSSDVAVLQVGCSWNIGGREPCIRHQLMMPQQQQESKQEQGCWQRQGSQQQQERQLYARDTSRRGHNLNSKNATLASDQQGVKIASP